MALLTSIVDIASIHIKKSPFSLEEKATEIEALANTIVDLGGLVNVPVVQQLSIDDYQLISGYLEYYAYLKACKINPHLPDRITVFISDAKNQAAINQQLEILQTIDSSRQNSSQPIALEQAEMNLQIKNLQALINNTNQNLLDTIERMRIELLEVIQENSPKAIPPIDAFNRILEPEIAFHVQRKLEFLGANKAKKIVAQLQEVSKQNDHKPFQSFSEILSVLKVQQKGRLIRLISEEKMVALIDRWHY